MGQDLNHTELIEHRLKELERCEKDHEERIRVLTEEITGHKTRTFLISLAAGLVALLALVKAFVIN